MLPGLAGLNQGTARPLSIVQLNLSWTAPVNATQLGQVFATGGIPMITWSCGDTDPGWRAAAMIWPSPPKPGPWPRRGPHPAALVPQPRARPGRFGPVPGQGRRRAYVQAYRDIVRQFRLAGATNVGFVWSVDTDVAPDPATPWAAYYPGDSFVDWIGADGDNETTSPPSVHRSLPSSAPGTPSSPPRASPS